MREILFRGKRKDNGEWVIGNLVHQTEYYGDPVDIYHIVDVGEFHSDYYSSEEVIPETVSQYTGMKDKNGTKIFEGDIVATRRDETRIKKLKGYYGYDSEGYPQKVPGYAGTSEYFYSTVVDCYAEVVSNSRSGYYLRGSSRFVDAICNEVVGNIHDNPELLKGE